MCYKVAASPPTDAIIETAGRFRRHGYRMEKRERLDEVMRAEVSINADRDAAPLRCPGQPILTKINTELGLRI